MSKKILSVMLALVLVLSALGTVAFAAGTTYEDEESTYSQTWELGTPVDNGDGTWSVEVSLTTDYPTGAIQFVVEETDPSNAITLTKVEAGTALYYTANISKNSAGKVLIVPKMVEGTNTVAAKAINGVIAKLTYSYTGTGSATIAIKDDAKADGNEGGTLIAVRVPDENLVSSNVVAGQIVNGVGDAQTIGAVAADPVLSGVNGGVVDTENGYVYGVPAGTEDLTAFFTVENGTFEMVANDGGYTNGTGATLVVKDNDSNEFATYTLIIFGDVNGDASITATDAATIEAASLGAEMSTVAYAFAADVNGDDAITATDAATVEAASLGGEITVNPYAA